MTSKMTQTLHWVSLSINHARNVSENGECSSYEEPNLCQNDIKEFQDLSFMYKYLQIANTYMFFYIYTYITPIPILSSSYMH